MARYIDADRITLPQGFFKKVDNVPKFYEWLSNIPTADVRENVNGKWIATQEWGGLNYFCSCCKFSFMVDTCMLEPLWNFCPNCGAELRQDDPSHPFADSVMMKGEKDELQTD